MNKTHQFQAIPAVISQLRNTLPVPQGVRAETLSVNPTGGMLFGMRAWSGFERESGALQGTVQVKL